MEDKKEQKQETAQEKFEREQRERRAEEEAIAWLVKEDEKLRREMEGFQMDFSIEAKIKRITEGKAQAKVREMDHETALSQVKLEFKKRKTLALITEYAKFLREWFEVECKYDLDYLRYDSLRPHEIVLSNSFCIPDELKDIAKFYASLDDLEKSVWKDYMIEHGQPNNLLVIYDKKDPQKYRDGWEAAADDRLHIKF